MQALSQIAFLISRIFVRNSSPQEG